MNETNMRRFESVFTNRITSSSIIEVGIKSLKYRKESFCSTRTSGPRYPPQFDRKQLPPGGVSLLGGSQMRTWEEEPPFNPPKSINFGGCSSGGDSSSGFLVWKPPNRLIPPGVVFLQSNTHYQFSIKTLFMIGLRDDYRKKDQFSIKTLLSQKNLKWSKTGLWQRVSTKKPNQITKKSPSVPERKKERKNERNLLSIFFNPSTTRLSA